MTSENVEERFQLIQYDITKESNRMRDSVLVRLKLATIISFLSTAE